ncbi:MAG: BNR repeat-containing protein [Candidatus Hydrogenedentes bacterium]|nr:BNR repeat-containing protein [Candidatus Hydrogenedentota bacterium]
MRKVGASVIDAEALTIKGGFGQSINGKSFQQDAVVSHGGYQYVGYYDAARRVCLARRKLPEGAWEIIRFGDYDFQSNDAHNTISVGVCPKDGTIHMAFDHHCHPLHYRVSRRNAATQPGDAAWDESLFGPVVSELEPGQPIRITYPRFWQTPDGGLQFCYRRGRSGNGDRMLVDYVAGDGRWANTRPIDSGKGVFEDAMGKSEARCSYPNGYDYGPRGRLHTTWVWRESDQGANHDLVYVYSEDGGLTWLNNAGEAIEGPPGIDAPGVTVAPIGRACGLMNTHGQAVDSHGRVHVVMWHCTDETLEAAASTPGDDRWGPPEARRYHHYWRDTDGTWQHRELPWVAGNRPKVFLDKADNALLIYTADGNLNIAAATAASQWTDWRVVHVEEGPFVNEMLGDPYRWRQEGVLSVMAQDMPAEPHAPTPLRILDFIVGVE